MRVHVALAAMAILLGVLLELSPGELATLSLTIGFVLALETLNSALEALLDLLQPDIHPLAGLAKDLAAGAVLLAAVTSLIVGGLLFLPRLWALLQTR